MQFDLELEHDRDAVWALLTEPERLSAWLSGDCRIEPWVGGRAVFELPEDGVSAVGVVRQVDPPDNEHAVAGVRHTFVDARWPDLVSECAWWMIDRPRGCALHFRHDGFGEIEAAALSDFWGRRFHTPVERVAALRRLVSVREAKALLRAARRVLLISFIGPEVPTALLEAGFEVFARTGPGERDWAKVDVCDRELVFRSMPAPPPQVDLVHLDWELGFDAHLELAARLGARTYWIHSARTKPPDPADNRGTWVPGPQSARQRLATEARGLAYVDNQYIADIARGLR